MPDDAEEVDETGLDPPWGIPGWHCYCTTGDSDYCEFCDEWVVDCECTDDVEEQ